MVCSNCGSGLRSKGSFCSRCGKKVYTDESQILKEGTFKLAKGFAGLLGIGFIMACGVSSAGLLGTACWLIYHFVQGTAAVIPEYFAATLPIASIEGVPLLFSGLTVMLAAVILAIAAYCLVQGLRAMNRKAPASAGNLQSVSHAERTPGQ